MTLLLRYALTQDGPGRQGGTDLGMHGQLRDSDGFVGYDIETLTVNVTNGSPIITSTAPNAFRTRAGPDLIDSCVLPAGTIVKRKNSNSQLTLSNPWPDPSGTADLTFHHDQHNYCVQFEMPVSR